jgi:2-iminobutanoate/2-iminopropanoate deaminase
MAAKKGISREVFAGDPAIAGLVRALKVGDTIYVSGTTAFEDGVTPPDDMAAQMRLTYCKIQQALAHFGGGMADVVEQTVFVTDMAAALAARHVRGEVYGETLPASATVEVAGLGRSGLKVEIKVTARLG